MLSLQITTIVLSVIGIVVWIRAAKKIQELFPGMVAVVCWLLNILLFYLDRLVFDFNHFTPYEFNAWSNIIRIQGILTVIVICIGFLAVRKKG